MALTKSDIVTAVHELGFTKKKSVDIIEALLEIIKGTLEKSQDVLISVKGTLEKSQDVLISGFGKFCVKNKSQRRGRNPATGQDLILRERRVITFKCSGKLRSKINGVDYSDQDF